MFDATQFKKQNGLDWTFRPFVEASGVTPEPTSDQITDYWSGYGELLDNNRIEVEKFDRRRKELGDDPDPDRLAGLDVEFREWQRKNAAATITRRIALLAALCSDCPTAEQLTELPGRILDAFQQAMQDALVPKASTSATSG
jgi:hypothetical protein